MTLAETGTGSLKRALTPNDPSFPHPRATLELKDGLMVDHSTRLKAWLIVALLFCFMLINFADKAIIGLAGVPIMKELGLTPQQYGFVGSSFFFLFSISAVLMGFVANRVKTKWLLFGMSIVWAVMQFPMIGTVTLPILITCRVMLGAGEGPISGRVARHL